MPKESLASRRFAMVRRFRESGLSARAFASLEQVSVGTLRLWRDRAKECDPELSDFVPVRVVESGHGQLGGVATIELDKGRRVHVSHGFDADEIVRLVGALESC